MDFPESLSLEDAIRGLMTCGFRFDDVETARGLMQKIAALAPEDEAHLSHAMAINAITLHGLVLWCGYCCEVFRKLDARGCPWHRQDVVLLVAEYAPSYAAAAAKLRRSKAPAGGEAECPEAMRIFWGAHEILHRVKAWGGRRDRVRKGPEERRG